MTLITNINSTRLPPGGDQEVATEQRVHLELHRTVETSHSLALFSSTEEAAEVETETDTVTSEPGWRPSGGHAD